MRRVPLSELRVSCGHARLHDGLRCRVVRDARDYTSGGARWRIRAAAAQGGLTRAAARPRVAKGRRRRARSTDVGRARSVVR